MATHFDLLVVLMVFSCFGVTGLTILGWMVWDGKRSAQKSLAELQRMTRAVAGLVVQESTKIRELMRD
jgi:uncharacterized iron-regulated membrane protein